MFEVRRETKALLAVSLLSCTLSTIPAHGAEVAQAHTSDAAGFRHEQNPEGYAALQRFTKAHERLYADEPEYHDRPEDFRTVCYSEISPECVDYLRQHSGSNTALASQLPELSDAPDYWNAYRQYLTTSPIGESMNSDGELYQDYSVARHDLIQAAVAWPKAQIASAGRVDVSQAATDFLHIRELMRRSSTLMDRMIFVAMMRIQTSTLNLAAAQAAAEGDREAIQSVMSALEPLSMLELSLRNTLSGEGSYSRLLTNTMGLNAADRMELLHMQLNHKRKLFEEYGAEMEEPKLLTQLEFDEWQTNLNRIQHVITEANAIAIKLSDASREEFWGPNSLWSDLPNMDSKESWAIPAYVEYLEDNRKLEINLAIVRELADHYFFNTPLRVPDDPPPPHFDWAWREDTRELCLIPVSVNSVIAASVEPACQPAWVSKTNSPDEPSQ